MGGNDMHRNELVKIFRAKTKWLINIKRKKSNAKNMKKKKKKNINFIKKCKSGK